MAYDPALLRPGDIGLVAGHAPHQSISGRAVDDLIDWATVNLFHHAFIVGPGTALVESLWLVTNSPLAKYAETAWIYRVNATPEQAEAAARWAQSRIGQRYGIAAILEDAARDIAHVPIWPRMNPKRVTCSGLVALAWQHAGVSLTHAPIPSPADLSYSPLLVGPRPWER